MWDKKVRGELSKAFLDALKEDTIPWRKCWNGAPTSFSTGKPYQGINNLMLSYVATQRGYRDTRWITYKHAQDQGWQVRKGEKSVRVEYWYHWDKVEKRRVEIDELLKIQKENPEYLKNICINAGSYNVFNFEQLDGDIPPLKQATVQDPSALLPSRDEFLENLGVQFREGGDIACYSPSTDTITLPYPDVFDSDYAYISTLLHEAGHSTGHASRLNRPMANILDKTGYAKEELRAEIASAFTAQALQLPYNEEELTAELDNHKAYIQSWIAILEKDPNELFAAIKDANKIADYLLDRGQLLELTLVAEEDYEKLKKKSVKSIPVGRIDYLSSNGRTGESIEYKNPNELETVIKENNYYGIPMRVVLYKQANGSVIPYEYILECDPPLNGFSIEEYEKGQEYENERENGDWEEEDEWER